MRVLITGSRDWYDVEMAERVVLRLMVKSAPEPLIIVHGACPTGIDKAFDDACRNCGATAEAHPARWEEHGKAAGPRRNAEMVALGADICVAFARDIRQSRGTRDCATQAYMAMIPTYLCETDEAIPSRVKSLDDLHRGA